MKQVTIIGSGIAAISAALEASTRGAQVTLVRGQPGATALMSGAWDMIEENTLSHLLHPQEELIPFLEKSIQTLSQSLDLKLQGSCTKTLSLLNPMGGIKTTHYATPVHASGNISEMRGAKLLVVGFRGLPQFSAPLVAHFIKNSKKTAAVFSQINTHEVSLGQDTGLLSPVALATRFDQEDSMDRLHQELVKVAAEQKTTHVALAPFIGVQKTTHILSRLREATNLVWFETLSLIPSIAGLRLQRQIDTLIKKSSWKIIEGTVSGAVTQGRKITSLKVKRNGAEEELAVERVILATGRYVGGGIVKEKAFREPVFHLPIFVRGQALGEVFVGKLVQNHFLDNHDLMTAGLRTNQNLQPVEERGQQVFENLWAAGAVLGGYNPATQSCGMGVAIGTGTLAGRLAAL